MCSCPSEHSAHSAAKTAPATRRGARPSRQAGAVFAQYRLRAHGRRAKRCCVRTVSFVAAHGRRAKAVLCLHSILRRGARPSREAVLCLHSILRRGARLSREGGAVFAQYRSRNTAIAKPVLVCTVSVAAERGHCRCCVCAVSLAEHGHCAKQVLCLPSILRPSRGTAIARRRCCVRTVSFMAAHGDRAKAVLCLHSILRGGARRSGEGGAVFAQYPSWRRTAIGRRRCCVCTCFAQFLSIDAKARR